MILYCTIIAVCVCLLTAANMIFAAPVFGFGFWFVLGAVLLSVVAVIAVDGLFAFLIRRLPAKWFAHDRKFFLVSQKEKKFYEKLKIRKWKEKIPELGQFTNFHKNKVAEPFNNDYLTRYMLEAAYGEVIHLALCVVGFVIIFFYPLKYWLCFGFPIAVINALLNLPSCCILRYNFYKLKILYASNERKAKRAQAAREKDDADANGNREDNPGRAKNAEKQEENAVQKNSFSLREESAFSKCAAKREYPRFVNAGTGEREDSPFSENIPEEDSEAEPSL